MFHGDKSERRLVLGKAGPEWVTPDRAKESGTSTFSLRFLFLQYLYFQSQDQELGNIRRQKSLDDEVIRSCHGNVTYIYTMNLNNAQASTTCARALHRASGHFQFWYSTSATEKAWTHNTYCCTRFASEKKLRQNQKNYGYPIVVKQHPIYFLPS